MMIKSQEEQLQKQHKIIEEQDNRITKLEKRNETLLQTATDLDKALRELEKENKELHFILEQHESTKNEGYDFQ